MQTYYYRQLKAARYFNPQLTEYEINYSIVQQCPLWVKENLATVNYNNSSVIGQILASLDSIRRERERNKQTYNQGPIRQSVQSVRQLQLQQPNGYSNTRNSRPRGNYRNTLHNNRPYSSQNYSTVPQYSNNNDKPMLLPDMSQPPPNWMNNAHGQNVNQGLNIQSQPSQPLN